jgi:hypothetical protein
VGVFAGPEIVEDGLVLYLDAGNRNSYPGSGTTWYDLSSWGGTATISGTNVWNDTYGGQFDFGESSQTVNYITLPHGAAQFTGTSYTMEFWMKPDFSSSTPKYFSSMASVANDNLFLLQQNISSLQPWNGTGSIPYSEDEYLQFCVVRNGSDTGTIYKNGGSATSATNITVINGVSTGGWILNQEQDSVGGGFDSSQNYRGAFMIVKLYNRALTAAEIQQNFNAIRGRYGI